MRERAAIQPFTEMFPVGYEFIHKEGKADVVTGFQEINQFMDNDIFEAFARFLARSLLERMLRVDGLQLPHLVFIRWT